MTLVLTFQGHHQSLLDPVLTAGPSLLGSCPSLGSASAVGVVAMETKNEIPEYLWKE